MNSPVGLGIPAVNDQFAAGGITANAATGQTVADALVAAGYIPNRFVARAFSDAQVKALSVGDNDFTLVAGAANIIIFPMSFLISVADNGWGPAAGNMGITLRWISGGTAGGWLAAVINVAMNAGTSVYQQAAPCDAGNTQVVNTMIGAPLFLRINMAAIPVAGTGTLAFNVPYLKWNTVLNQFV